MKLHVVSIEKERVRIQAEGEITSHDFTADGKSPFELVLGSGWAAHQVILDMRGVPYLDSSAVGWLMTSRRAFENAGGMIVLHSLQPRVAQVLDLLRVGKILPLVEDEAAALTVIAAAATGLKVTTAQKPAPARAASAKPRRAGKAA